MSTQTSQTDLLTVDDVARRLNCSPKTLRREIQSGALDCVRIGPARRLVRISEKALRVYLALRDA